MKIDKSHLQNLLKAKKYIGTALDQSHAKVDNIS